MVTAHSEVARQLGKLARVLKQQGADFDELAQSWDGASVEELAGKLGEVGSSACGLAEQLRDATKMVASSKALARAAKGPAAVLLLVWAESAAGRSELHLAPLLAAADKRARDRSRLQRASRARVMKGPLRDALSCLPIADDGAWMVGKEGVLIQARIDLLLWEAGQLALGVPALARWVWGEGFGAHSTRGPLLSRALAARAMACAAEGCSSALLTADRRRATTERLQSLIGHPDAAVWIPAARAIGRLAARFPALSALAFSWAESDNLRERRRGVTAVGCMPAAVGLRVRTLLEQLVATAPPRWLVAALGPALPTLVSEHREIWDALKARLRRGKVTPEVLRGLTRGLLPLAQRDGVVDELLRWAREQALRSGAKTASEARVWHAVRRETDFIDDLEPDQGDPDLCLERLVSDALRLGARSRAMGQVARRARSLARSLGPLFAQSLQDASDDGDKGERGLSLATMESCARAASLALWEPIMAAAGKGRAARRLRPELCEVRAAMLGQAAEQLAVPDPDSDLHRTTLRVLGRMIDATDITHLELVSERGDVCARAAAAVGAAPWLAKPTKRAAKPFLKPLADLMWRLLDATCGRSAAAAFDTRALARFAAWWVIARPASGRLLALLAQTEGTAPTMAAAQLKQTFSAMRKALDPASSGALDGGWWEAVEPVVAACGAERTLLRHALALLADAQRELHARRGVGSRQAITEGLERLSLPCSMLGVLVGDPVAALAIAGRRPPDERVLDGRARPLQGSRSQLAQAWAEGLGHRLGPLVAETVSAAFADIPRALPPPRRQKKVGPYQLGDKLGGGAMGEVWLVKAPATDRLFVMKIPLGAFAGRPAEERQQMVETLEFESEVMRTLYHPNLAGFIDYGWDGDTPYLVLEYLIGVDLDHYMRAKLLSLEELAPIVRDVCSGLQHMHRHGLVHRDLKPGNVFLRLDLGPDERFDPERHRDPAKMPVLNAVVIDFGLVRTFTTKTGKSENVIAGTPGYLSPEQARGSAILDGRSDIYGLAATVHAAHTGHRFFEGCKDVASRVIAHMKQAPFAEDTAKWGMDPELAALLEAATDMSPDARPDVPTFARQFTALVDGCDE